MRLAGAAAAERRAASGRATIGWEAHQVRQAPVLVQVALQAARGRRRAGQAISGAPLAAPAACTATRAAAWPRTAAPPLLSTHHFAGQAWQVAVLAETTQTSVPAAHSG